MPEVLSRAQNASIGGRQILDTMLVAKEATDSIVLGNSSVVLCKLYSDKAYNHVDWSFLLSMLSKMDFSERWMRWISWQVD